METSATNTSQQLILNDEQVGRVDAWLRVKKLDGYVVSKTALEYTLENGEISSVAKAHSSALIDAFKEELINSPGRSVAVSSVRLDESGKSYLVFARKRIAPGYFSVLKAKAIGSVNATMRQEGKPEIPTF